MTCSLSNWFNEVPMKLKPSTGQLSDPPACPLSDVELSHSFGKDIGANRWNHSCWSWAGEERHPLCRRPTLRVEQAGRGLESVSPPQASTIHECRRKESFLKKKKKKERKFWVAPLTRRLDCKTCTDWSQSRVCALCFCWRKQGRERKGGRGKISSRSWECRVNRDRAKWTVLFSDLIVKLKDSHQVGREKKKRKKAGNTPGWQICVR